MMCEKTNIIPQVGNNPIVDSDQVRALVVDVNGLTDSGGDRYHTTDKENSNGRRVVGNDRLMELEAEAEKILSNLKRTIDNMVKKSLTRKNLDSFVTTGLQEAKDALFSLYSNRRSFKSALEKSSVKEVQPVSTQFRARTHSTMSTPGGLGTRKRQAETTPSPSNGGFHRPRKRPTRIESEAGEWTEVMSRSRYLPKTVGKNSIAKETQAETRRDKKRRRIKPEAIIIKPGEGNSYAEVLKVVRKNVKPSELGVNIKGIRETKAGHVLLEIGAIQENRLKFEEAIQKVVGDKAHVRTSIPKSWIDIKDLDATVEEQEVEDALKKFFGSTNIEIEKMYITKRNKWGSKMAICQLDEQLAIKLEEKGHITVGWVNCRVKRKACPVRCFRCLGYGHQKTECTSVDRSEDCWKCGSKGHKAGACTSQPLCYLCQEKSEQLGTDHVPGSYKCTIYRDEVKKIEDSWR